jgi:hypothetical protein
LMLAAPLADRRKITYATVDLLVDTEEDLIYKEVNVVLLARPVRVMTNTVW